MVAHRLGGDAEPLDVCAWSLTALGFGVAAIRVLRTPNDAWDLAPAAR